MTGRIVTVQKRTRTKPTDLRDRWSWLQVEGAITFEPTAVRRWGLGRDLWHPGRILIGELQDGRTVYVRREEAVGIDVQAILDRTVSPADPTIERGPTFCWMDEREDRPPEVVHPEQLALFG